VVGTGSDLMRRRALVVVAVVAAAVVLQLAPVTAQAPAPTAGRLQEHEVPTAHLAEGVVPVTVLLPAGYDDPAHAGRRYPVVWFLRGCCDDPDGRRQFVNPEGGQGDLEAQTAGDAFIAIIPEAGPFGFYTDWLNGGEGGPPAWESAHIDDVLPWVDATFRTIPDRDARALVGISMGGYGAMHYASRHPDLFGAAVTMSGAVDILNPTFAPAFTALGSAFLGPGGTQAIWGDRVADEANWTLHNPTSQVAGLADVAVAVTYGEGCGPGGDALECELSQHGDHLRAALDAAGIAHEDLVYAPGAHTWPYWNARMADFTLPFVRRHFAEALAGPAGVVRLVDETAICRAAVPAVDAGRRVVLARDDVFADALAAAPLAGAGTCVLYTDADGPVADVVMAEIGRVLPPGGEVLLAGGEQAVPAAAEAQLADAGFAVRRVAGPTRYETAAAMAALVAEEHPGSTTALLAWGGDFPDAVAGGAHWAAAGVPVLLTPTDALHPAAGQALADLGIERTAVLGGEAVVSPAAMAAAPGAVRVAGPDRMATAAAVARTLAAQPIRAVVVGNLDRADGWRLALAGAPLAALHAAPLLGVGTGVYPAATEELLEGLAPLATTAYVLGDEAHVDGAVATAVGEDLAGPPHVTVYSGTAGFRHLSIPHVTEVIADLADRTGAFTVELTEDPAALTPDLLARTDVVLWLSTTGAEAPFDQAQRSAYAGWMACGGAHHGVHASTDSYRDWPEWEEVTGAFFAGHPLTPTSIADDQDPATEGSGEPEAVIGVADPDHPATAPWAGQASFTHRDEYYHYDRDPATTLADFASLLTFGGFTDPAVAAAFGSDYPPDMPVAWTGSFRGANRVFYTNLGHSVIAWDVPAIQAHVVGGITWTAGVRPDPACLAAAGIG
jgi:S-formylglutathione hydrolase FrmB/putative cell wall-binding protein/type 1 glutamine amidotransferase